jgi:uncharacterized protein
VNDHERLIRDLYAARSRRDFDGVRRLLADDAAWHEPGNQDYSGDYRGADEIIALLRRLVEVTQGTFELVPEGFLHAAEHSAVLVRWWAERGPRRAEGNEIAVYRVRDARVVEAWFYPDGYDPEAVQTVFAYGS